MSYESPSNDAKADAFPFDATNLVETVAQAMLLGRMMKGEYPESRPATCQDVCEIASEIVPDETAEQRSVCLLLMSRFIARMKTIGVFNVDVTKGRIWKDHNNPAFMVPIPGSFEIANPDRAARIGRRFLAEIHNRYPGVI